MKETTTTDMWMEKRRELAGRIREQRAEAEASRFILQHERAEKARRNQKLEHSEPAARQRPSHNTSTFRTAAEHTLASGNTMSFNDMCNNRRTAPTAPAMQGWEGGGPTATRRLPTGGLGQEGTREGPNSGMVYSGNAVWNVRDAQAGQHAPSSHTAPRGFPIRKAGDGQPRTGRGGDKSAFAAQAGLASTLANSRSELDMLLMERVAQLAATVPAPPQNRVPGVTIAAKKKQKAR